MDGRPKTDDRICHPSSVLGLPPPQKKTQPARKSGQAVWMRCSQTCGSGGGGGGRYFARGGLAVADARAADDVVLRRVVAVNGLDAAAQALDFVPDGLAERFALVAGVGQLGFEPVHQGSVRRDLVEIGFERFGGQVADLEARVNAAPGFKDTMSLFGNVAGGNICKLISVHIYANIILCVN